MATHMSIRLAWHNEGWNGHFCKKPCENTFCIGQHSYPGDLIAGTRDLEFETEHAGEPCSKYPCGAACGLSVNAFGKDSITVKVDPPSFWKQGDADSINITLPPSTVCTWCYEAMYNDDVETKGESAQKYNYDKRKAGAERYFAQFEPEKSLIFYYAGYSNPFSENEENNYVIVGVSRVKKIGDTYYYDNISEEIKRKYSGGFVWQKPVTSTYPNEGFCIPYWKYMDDEDLIERLVIKPLNRSPFKYGSREVSNDDAIEVINQLIAVVDILIEIEDDSEDWSKRKEWLNSVLNELWTARGPFPGFPSIMECIGLSEFVSKYIGLTIDSEMKQFRDDVRSFLDGEIDEVAGIAPSKADMKKIRREYQLLGKTTIDFMIDKLLASENLPKEVEVQVGTIHGFQGDECDIIFAVFNTPPSISASKEMFLNKKNIINVSISRARDYLFVVMPDDETENIDNLRLVKRVEGLIQSTDAWNEFASPDLEDLMFGDPKYLENNAFSTSHQSVNVYGLPEKIYEVRTEDAAVDVQIHRAAGQVVSVEKPANIAPEVVDSYDLDETLIPEKLRRKAIDLPVRGAINGWCYLVPYEGKLKHFTVKKTVGMFIPLLRNGQEKMVSVSVVEEDRIIYISYDMFKLYEQGLSEPDGIRLKKCFI